MADDRMYLKCKVCGEACYIGKTYICKGYYTEKAPKEYHDKLMAFFDKHAACIADDGKPKTQTFELLYESDDAFNEIQSFF